MSDLVNWLRHQEHEFCVEAADEIERLRAGGCTRDQTTTQWCAEAVDAIARAKSAEAQVTALREILQEARWHFVNSEEIAIKIDAALAQSQKEK